MKLYGHLSHFVLSDCTVLCLIIALRGVSDILSTPCCPTHRGKTPLQPKDRVSGAKKAATVFHLSCRHRNQTADLPGTSPTYVTFRRFKYEYTGWR